MQQFPSMNTVKTRKWEEPHAFHSWPKVLPIPFLYWVNKVYNGLPQWLTGKEFAHNARDVGNMGLIPGSGRSPGGGNGNPLKYSWLENPMDRGAWWAIVNRTAKSWTQLKWLNTHHGCCGVLYLPCFQIKARIPSWLAHWEWTTSRNCLQMNRPTNPLPPTPHQVMLLSRQKLLLKDWSRWIQKSGTLDSPQPQSFPRDGLRPLLKSHWICPVLLPW